MTSDEAITKIVTYLKKSIETLKIFEDKNDHVDLIKTQMILMDAIKNLTLKKE